MRLRFSGLIRVQGAKPEATAGHERAQPQMLGRRQGRPVVGRRHRDIGRSTTGCDLGEQAQGAGLRAALAILARQGKGASRELGRLVRAIGGDGNLAESPRSGVPSSSVGCGMRATATPVAKLTGRIM